MGFQGVAFAYWAKCAMFMTVYTLETMMKIVDAVNQQLTNATIGYVDKAGDKWWVTAVSLMRETYKMDITQHIATATSLPSWVPMPAQIYLAYTQAGLPIRALARMMGCLPLRFYAKFARLRPAAMICWMTPSYTDLAPTISTPPVNGLCPYLRKRLI